MVDNDMGNNIVNTKVAGIVLRILTGEKFGIDGTL